MIRFSISAFGFAIRRHKRMRQVSQIRLVPIPSDNRKSAIQKPKWLWLSVVAFVLVMVVAATQAQQEKPTPRIGVLLSGGSRNPIAGEAFRNALRELGYIEGQNIRIEYRDAAGDSRRQLQLAKELAALQVDVLVASGGNDVTQALMSASKSTPIVMTAGSNPVERGIIASLARPGGNVTGLTSNWDDLSGKRLELLKETIPALSLVAVLWNSTGGRQTQWKASQAATKQLNLQLHSMQIHSGDDLENSFRAAVKARSAAVAVTQSSEIATNIQHVIGLAAKHRLPAIYATPEYADAGGLIVYGSNRRDLARRAAIYVDKNL